MEEATTGNVNGIAVLITTAGGIIITIIGMLIKGKLDHEKLKRETKFDCDAEIEHERAIHHAQVHKLEQELEAVTSVFEVVQTRYTALPVCYMTLEGVFISISPLFAEAMEPIGIKADDLVGNDGLNILPKDVFGLWKLTQGKAIHDGAAISMGFTFGRGLPPCNMVIEAMPDNKTLVCKLLPV